MSFPKITAIVILAVATILIILSIAQRKVVSPAGATKSVTLNDGTKLKLGPASSLTYNRLSYYLSSKVRLQGEALCEIGVGNRLRVITANGIVVGEGGTHRIISRRTTMNVFCTKGKSYTSNIDGGAKHELTGGDFVSYRGKNIGRSGTKRIDQMTSDKYFIFDGASLLFVMEAIEAQYGIRFDAAETNTNRTYNGAVTREYQEVALAVVFSPLNISYEVQGNEVVLTNQN